MHYISEMIFLYYKQENYTTNRSFTRSECKVYVRKKIKITETF